MVDLAMCKNEDCPVKKSCYRYLAKPDSYQSYFTGIKATEEGCDVYWKVSSEEEVNKLNREWW